ncbi:MAG: hypothetical protein DMG12_01760 [Acidobacteria bacterium]|nr:MAG: hypothetical protein DMG12_01760 [Acidobacteriota bacterium]
MSLFSSVGRFWHSFQNVQRRRAFVQTNPFKGIPETFYETDHLVSANFGCFAAFFMIAQPPR